MQKKHITLIATGSIAAVKSIALIEQLHLQQIEVSLVITHSAQQWITKEAAQHVLRNDVLTADDISRDPLLLSAMLAKSDAIVVAPATADILNHLVRRDNELADKIRGSGKPLVVAPAMNVMMWQHPATQRNCAALLAEGVLFLGAVAGNMACGDKGYGRFMEPETIAPAIAGMLAAKQHPAFTQVQEALTKNAQIPSVPPTLADKADKKLLLIIQGGSDALATYPLISSLRARGFDVTCVASPAALALVPQHGLATISCNMAYTHHYQDDVQGMEHIRLPERSDIVVIAPATADYVKEMAQGGAHSFIGSLYLASKKPVVIIPSVDPVCTPDAADLETLRSDGASVIDISSDLSLAGKQRAEAIAEALLALIHSHTRKHISHVG